MSTKRQLVVGVTDIVRRPGTRRKLQRAVVIEGIGMTSAVVPPGAELELDLELDALSDGIVVTGTITTPWAGECRRCLREVRGTAQVELREIFERRPVDGETYLLDNEVIDLEQMVRDAVLLALPLAPLCADDCLGPAPEEFPAGVEADEIAAAAEAERRASVDPRWSGLDQLKFDH